LGFAFCLAGIAAIWPLARRLDRAAPDEIGNPRLASAD